MIYPQIIIGNKLIQKILTRSVDKRLYVCQDVEFLRKIIGDLIYLKNFDEEVIIFLRFPNRRQFDVLLKFLEESTLKIILLVPYDCCPDTIVSRAAIFMKDDEIKFFDFLDSVKVGENLKNKLFDLFGRVREKNNGFGNA